MTAVNGTNQLWAHILFHEKLILNAKSVVDRLNKKFNNFVNKEKVNTQCLKFNQLVAVEHDMSENKGMS